MALGSRNLGTMALAGGDGAPTAPLPTGVAVVVNATDLSAALEEASISITHRLGSRSVASFRLYDLQNQISIAPGQSVLIHNGGELEFAGSVEDVGEEFPSQDPANTAKIIDVQCVDHNAIPARRVISAVYDRQEASETVKAVVAATLSAEGVMATDETVVPAPVVGAINWDHDRVSDVLDALAKILGWHWWVDDHRALHFAPWDYLSAPWDITASDPRPFRRLSIRRTRRGYVNVQTVRGGDDVGAPRTRVFTGDGERTNWNVDFPIAREPTVEVLLSGGAYETKTVGIRGFHDEDDPDGFEFFWKQGDRSVSQNSEHTELTAADSIRITYAPIIPILVKSTDTAAIAERQGVEGGTGLYEAVVTKRNIETANLVSAFGEARVRERAQISVNLSIETTNTGLRPGQVQNIVLGTEGINDDFLIVSVTKRGIGSDVIFTTYECVNNEADGGWPEFWKNLADSGEDFKLSGGNDEISTVGQVQSVAAVTDSDDSASGDSLATAAADKYTAFVVGKAMIGRRYSERMGLRPNEAAQTFNVGAFIAQMTELA